MTRARAEAAKLERWDLEHKVWRATHRDYRSVLADGRRAVLMLDRKTGGTCLAPLASLTDDELRARM